MNDAPRASRLEVLGVPLDPVSQRQAVDILKDFLNSQQFHLVVTLGTEMVMHGQEDPDFVTICRGASLVVPDGMGLVWAGRLCGHGVPQRVAGIELVQAMAASLAPSLRLFLLGAAPGVAEEAAAALRSQSPNLQVVGVRDGYFQDDEEVVREVAASGANLLLVGLGFPRQEKWLAHFGSRTGARVGIGVGGSFDVLSGRVKRAPDWMIRVGLEWLYRFCTQPTRWRRMLALPRFILKVVSRGRKDAVRSIAVDGRSSERAPVTVSYGENAT